MRCRVGDLAVVIRANLPSNLGNIVRIVAPCDGRGDIVFTKEGPVWIVECQRRMTWELRGKRYRRKKGPVPDNRLQPIRGVAAGEGDRDAAEVGESEGEGVKWKVKRFAEMAD